MLTEQEISNLLDKNPEILTEAQLEFLIENRIQFIKNNVKDKIDASHDPAASKLDSDGIVDHIASKIDPTHNKEYTQWLVNRYKNKEFSLGDHKDLKKQVSAFHEARPLINVHDIGSVKSLSELSDHVAIGKGVVAAHKAAENEAAAPMEEVFREGDIYGVKVPNARVSTRNYGPNGKIAQTRWCTASEGANAFNTHKGGKYVIHLPNGEVGQMHHQSNQFMDKNDTPIKPTNEKFSPYKEQIDRFIKHTYSLEGNIDPSVQLKEWDQTPPSHSNGKLKALYDENNRLLDSTPSGYDVPRDQINKLEYNTRVNAEHAQHIASTHVLSDEDFQQALVPIKTQNKYSYTKKQLDERISNVHKNPHLTTSQLHSVIDAGMRVDINHKSMDKDGLHKIISKYTKPDNYTATHVLDALYHPLADSDHVTQAWQAMPLHRNNILAAIKDKKIELPRHVITDSLTDPELHTSLAKTSATSQRHVAMQLANSNDSGDRVSLLSNPHTHKDAVTHILDNTPGKLRGVDYRKLLDREDVGTDDISHVIKSVGKSLDSTDYGIQQLAIHPKLTRDHFEQLVKAAPNVISSSVAAMNARRIKPVDIDYLLDNKLHGDTDISNFLNSRSLKSSHIDKLIDTHPDRVATHINENSNEVFTHQNHEKLINSNISFHNKAKLLAHPKVSLTSFTNLSSNPRLHGAIVSSPYAPPSILHSLATSGMDHIRAMVAAHKNASAGTLKILSNDSNAEVAATASKRIKK